MEKKLLTRKEVAAKFSVEPLTVREWEKQRKLPVDRKINNRPRYDADVVSNLFKETTTNDK